MTEWQSRSWGELATLRYGRALRGYQASVAPYRVFGTNGPIGWHHEALFPAGVIVGRKGAYRGIHYSTGPCWVIDTAFYLDIHDSDEVDPRWAYYQLRTVDLNSIDSGSAIPSTTRDSFGAIRVSIPPLPTQRRVASILTALDELIENNRRRIELMERTAHAIYREWFVRFCFPGHENGTFIDSPMGQIPTGWHFRRVSEVASKQRNAVTGGPFGSKLGRKDYTADGVPVLRGGNLRVGGGFDETNLVYVSLDKADELRGCLARRGDVVVTQRGTLGQVGLIPTQSRYNAYVLSQSQMKITVDQGEATPEFLYAQLRTATTTERFIAQAMSSGVPHVNLALLRDFQVLVPPVELQQRFTHVTAAIAAMEWQLGEASRTLTTIRDTLLPKLVSGRIDVSHLDLGVGEATVA